jgi:hypothetical protein
MEKILQDVGKDILPGVSYIDHSAVHSSGFKTPMLKP